MPCSATFKSHPVRLHSSAITYRLLPGGDAKSLNFSLAIFDAITSYNIMQMILSIVGQLSIAYYRCRFNKFMISSHPKANHQLEIAIITSKHK